MSLQGKELEELKERSKRSVAVASELVKSIEALKHAPEGGNSSSLDLDVLLSSLQELQQNSEICAKLVVGAPASKVPSSLPLPQLPPIEVRACCAGMAGELQSLLAWRTWNIAQSAYGLEQLRDA